MATKVRVLFIALLIQVISGQYIGRPLNAAMATAENSAITNSIAYGSLANGYGGIAANGIANGMAYTPAAAAAAAATGLANNLAYEATLEANAAAYPASSSLSSGGGFRVTSSSPIAASGITVQSDNLLIEGPLAVSGQMPFTGVVAVEGPLAAIGQGSVAYGCGNGNVGIVSEGLEPPFSNGIGVEASLPAVGYGSKGYSALY